MLLTYKSYWRRPCHTIDPTLKDQILIKQFEERLLVKWKRQLKCPINTFKDALQQALVAKAVQVQLISEKVLEKIQPPVVPISSPQPDGIYRSTWQHHVFSMPAEGPSGS